MLFRVFYDALPRGLHCGIIPRPFRPFNMAAVMCRRIVCCMISRCMQPRKREDHLFFFINVYLYWATFLLLLGNCELPVSRRSLVLFWSPTAKTDSCFFLSLCYLVARLRCGVGTQSTRCGGPLGDSSTNSSTSPSNSVHRYPRHARLSHCPTEFLSLSHGTSHYQCSCSPHFYIWWVSIVSIVFCFS